MHKNDAPVITLYNTLGRMHEQLPAKKKLTMYVCGVTPYDHAHLGHGRCYVTFDVLFRLLTFLGYDVTYARNFTDIDDKLLRKAADELNDATQYLTIANRYIASYHDDMKALACLSPHYEPRVTTHIGPIIKFIEELVAKGKAYATEVGDVYFSIDSLPEYGKLSQRSLEDLQAGARVDVRSDKKHPGDFALWKAAEEQPGWDSPWGFGRPGWHIECSAMASEYLGDTIDIHGGGMDLVFPHHENEVAQSEGRSGKTFANIWMHNAFVRMNEEKMSKSLGNFMTLKDALTEFGPMVLRYYYVIHHYRNPLDFSPEDIHASAKSYQKLCLALDKVQPASAEAVRNTDDELVQQLLAALCNDLNVAKCMGLIFEHLKTLTDEQKSLIKGLVMQVLGLDCVPMQTEVVITPAIQALLNARNIAREVKDWKTADEIRDKLLELGVDVQDKKL